MIFRFLLLLLAVSAQAAVGLRSPSFVGGHLHPVGPATPLYENYLMTNYTPFLLAYWTLGDSAAPAVDISANVYSSQSVGADAPLFGQTSTIPNTLKTSVKFPLNATPASTKNNIALEGALTNRLRTTNMTAVVWFKRNGTGSAGASGTGTGGIIAEPLITKGGAESETTTFNMNWGFGLELITNPDASTGNLYVSADFEKDASGNLTDLPTGRNARMMDVSTLTTTVTSLNAASATATLTAMPYLVGDRVRFGGTTVGAGVTAARWYYITATPTTNTFQVASTPGGSAISLSTVVAGGGAWINHCRNTVNLGPSDTGWHMAAVTWDGTTLITYLDGVQAELETPTMKPAEALTQQRAHLSAYGTSSATVNGYWNGWMQHVALWATNQPASAISNLYANGIVTPSSSPVVTIQPNAGTMINRLATNSMTVTASGSLPITYQWRHKGTNIGNTAHWTGSTSNVLTITAADETDGGDYYCVVNNGVGSTVSAISKVVIFHATDDGLHLLGNVAVLGDRESGFDATRATAVDNAILADTEITNVVSVGDLAASGETYPNNNSVLLAAIQARGGNMYPTIGNHDYDGSRELEIGPYFTGISNNNNAGLFYYSKQIGDVEFFMVDDNSENTANAGGITTTASAFQASTMGQWILAKIAASTAAWKVFMTHHPAYTDSVDGNNTANQWSFSTLGVQLYIQGHAHGAERIYTNGIFYYTAALGGAVAHAWGTKWQQTEFRVEAATPQTNGWLKICASSNKMILEYYDTRGTNIDRTVLTQ